MKYDNSCRYYNGYDAAVLGTAVCQGYTSMYNCLCNLAGVRMECMRKVGCICKRKFTNDVTLVRQLKRVAEHGDIAVIYPEARYSLCGTNAVLPESLGKLAKLLKVPVVTLICHGHHINSPFWNTGNRRVKGTEAVLTQIITSDEIGSLTIEEINRRINEKFVYDDYTWKERETG